MTGVILTNLDAALKDRKRALSQHPDDYVVNLLVDEAASVVVSDIMNDLPRKGGDSGSLSACRCSSPNRWRPKAGEKST